MQELQSLVDEREGKAQELEHILTERQEESDRIVDNFDKQIRELIAQAKVKLDEMEGAVKGQVELTRQQTTEQIASNQKALEEQIEAGKAFQSEQIEAVKNLLSGQAKEANERAQETEEEIKNLLEESGKQLDSLKNELSEKVHAENVKCYRNIQDLFKEYGEKLEQVDETSKKITSVKGYVKCLSWFSILNFVVLVGYILYSIGVFHF